MDAQWHGPACDRLSEIREDEAFRQSRSVQQMTRELLALARAATARHALGDWDGYWGATSHSPAHRRVLTDLASRPLTVARLLDDLELNGDNPVRVHVMAAAAKELESLELYQLLATLWPGATFDIALVGPELSKVPLPQSSRVTLSMHATVYRRALWTELGQPHLIVGFDAGLLHYRTWGPTLLELLGSGVLVAITSYRSWEARAEAALLDRLGAVPVRPPQPNPFASQAFRRSMTVANDVSRDNAYVSVWC